MRIEDWVTAAAAMLPQEPLPDKPAPDVYYDGVFRRIRLSPALLLDAGWTVVDGVWIAPPSLIVPEE